MAFHKEYTRNPTNRLFKARAGHFEVEVAPKQTTTAYELHLRQHSNIKRSHNAVKHTVQSTQTLEETQKKKKNHIVCAAKPTNGITKY